MRLARFDVENETPIRGADGFCTDCALGEPGELLFPIKPDDPSTTFAGYEDPKARSNAPTSTIPSPKTTVNRNPYFR